MKTLAEVIQAAKLRGYTIDTRPYALNLIGIRNLQATDQKSFDDEIAYFYYDDRGQVVGKVCPATTDPSTYWLNNPMNPMGAAILKAGEYRDTWSIGLHKGVYEALVQSLKPVTVIRDDDRNSYINYFAPTSTGKYGINIHKASSGKNDVKIIGKDSAGCQVFRDEEDFKEMMNLAKESRKRYGNKFSYILIDERDVVKLVNTTGLGLLVLGVAYYLYVKFKK